MLLLVIPLIVLIILVESEFLVAATLVTIATMVTLLLWSWWADVAVFGWILDNAGLLIGLALTYVVGGVIWAFIKWGLYLRRPSTTARIRNALEIYHQNGPRANETSEQFVRSYADLGPSHNKARIVAWMTWWPLSLVGTILRDVFVNLWRNLYTLLAGTFDGMVKSRIERLDGRW